MASAEDKKKAGELALEVLLWLDEEGDAYGECVDNRCRSAPCKPDCRILKALKLAGLK